MRKNKGHQDVAYYISSNKTHSTNIADPHAHARIVTTLYTKSFLEVCIIRAARNVPDCLPVALAECSHMGKPNLPEMQHRQSNAKHIPSGDERSYIFPTPLLLHTLSLLLRSDKF